MLDRALISQFINENKQIEESDVRIMLGLANSISGMPYISSSTFSIANVPDLSVWLKNAGTQTLNSGNISQWNDESGNNNHAVQTTASFQPQADGGGALLDGSDDRFDLTLN